MKKLLILIMLVGCDGPRLSESIESLVRKNQDATVASDSPVPRLKGE